MVALRRAVFPLSAVVVLTASLVVPMPWFVERPGEVLDLASRIRVRVPGAQPVDGVYLLTSVNVRRAGAWDVAGAAVGATELRPVASLIPAGQRDGPYFDEQRAVFASTADLAAALGLDAAGFAGDGALVVAVVPGSPADGALQPSDIVVAVDGQPVATGDELVQAVTGAGVVRGERTFSVRRGEQRLEIPLVPRPLEGDRPQVGVQILTARPDVPVEVDAGRTGGPSAALMIALTVYDAVAGDVDLAAGRTIAGTGTLAVNGRVGEIGGIAQKVVAAERAGAEIFLAPASQAEQARGAVPGDGALEVLGVSTLDEALTALGGPAPD